MQLGFFHSRTGSILSLISLTFCALFLSLYSPAVHAGKDVPNRDIDRKVLFELAFENLGLYMTAVEAELRLDPFEKKAFNDIAKLANNRKYQSLGKAGQIFSLGFSENIHYFKLNNRIVTAITNPDPLTPILVNLNIVNDASIPITLLDAIQIMVHEFANKTEHLQKPYVDSLAAKIHASLQNHFVTYNIQPNYSISVLGLKSPFINLYNHLRAQKVPDHQIVTEMAAMTSMYPGREVTILENRPTKIIENRRISGYLTNPVGFSNMGQSSNVGLKINAMAAVQNIASEYIGTRFPVIKISLSSFQEIAELDMGTGTFSTPKVVKMDLTRQMALNQQYFEFNIHTGRNGIEKITKRDFNQQYYAESAKITRFELKDGKIEGEGTLDIAAVDMAEMRKAKPRIDLFLKFKGGQTKVLAETMETEKGYKFKFSTPLKPEVEAVLIDQIEIRHEYNGRYRKLNIPVDEVKQLDFKKTPQKNSFDLVFWNLTDATGVRALEVGSTSMPQMIARQNENVPVFDMLMVLRSETPIRELVLTTRAADNILDEDGKIKFSRYLDETIRYSADQFGQQKIGPYYKVWFRIGRTLTPTVQAKTEDGQSIEAIRPDNKIAIMKMRAINQGLQVVRTDDPITAMILNGVGMEETFARKCKSFF